MMNGLSDIRHKINKINRFMIWSLISIMIASIFFYQVI
jgi:hypothetical protein